MDAKEILCQAGRIMSSKRLTDMAGGNISLRVADIVYMSPRFAGQAYKWNLSPDLIVSGRWADDEITKNPAFSREGWSHLELYRAFPLVTAVVHAHAFHIMPFTAFQKNIEPVLEATNKFGVVEFCKPAPAHTRELAGYVVEAMHGKETMMKTQAAAVMIPFHGIILCGENFDKTLDALERIDVNAYCLLSRKALE